MKLVLKVIIYLVFLYLTVLMVKLTLPYLSLTDNIAFLRIKQWVIDNQIWKFSFYLHVFTSCLLLIAGSLQFSATVFKYNPKIHRVAGVIYIILLLFFSAPSGFIMAIYANGGPIAVTAFLTLTLLWIFTTVKAYQTIKQKDYLNHSKWMIRSFALTLSALTLRVWKPSLAFLFEIRPMDLYRLVAWVGFVPNLIIAEIIIKNGGAQKLLNRFTKKSLVS